MSDNPNFVAKYSTDVIWVGQDMTLCLTDELNNKADIDHVHSNYASVSDLETLEEAVNNKINVDDFYNELDIVREEVREEVRNGLDEELNGVYEQLDEHTFRMDDIVSELENKADIDHTHDEYALTDDLTALEDIVSTKADSTHTHEEYASVSHSHDNYATQVSFDTLSEVVNGKADATHEHNNYVTTTSFDTLSEEVNGKANISHTHTEYALSSHEHTNYAEVGHTHDYAETTHNHDNVYVSQTNFDALENTVSTKANVSDLNGHTNNTEIHITDVERNNWNAKSDFSGNYNDLTNKPSIPSVDGLASEDYVDTKVGTITVESIGALPNTTEIPTVPTNVSAFTNDAGYLTEHQSLDGLATETYVDAQIDAIDIPTALSDLTADSTHRVVTDSEKAVWDAKSDFSGSYNDLTDKPSIPSISGLATETYVDEAVSTKANVSHNHDDRYYTEQEIETKLADKADSSHTHTGVYDVNGAAASALTSANAYTDNEIEVLSGTVGTKANASDLTSHTGNTTVHITSTERNNWNTAKVHADSAHAPSNAEPNQNAFSNVVVNGTTISADSKTDTLTLVAGNNVTITPDATGDSITISSANTVYTHPTSAGNKHIPAGGSSGQILRWSADGTAVWGNDNNTTYSNATQTSSGLMSDTDKTKLDGIAEGANKYTLPSAGTSLGGVKSGGDVTISSGVITVNDDSHNHVISNIDGLQSALDSKATSGHTHNDTYYTETEVDTLLSGKANTSHTHTIANITNLQSTLDGKASASHGTHVSYSTTAPVMDGSASVGTASTVARSDHKHPTDTSRAAQTSLDSHTGNKSNPHGVSLAQLGITATASELNTLDGITATVTELNFVDGVTSNIQTQLNGKAASSHTHTIANINNLQTTLDGKAASSHNHSATNITSGTLSSDRLPTVPISKGGTGATTATGVLTNLGITATASELNYVDGVTSNIQTQLNGKAGTSHTHSYLPLSGGTITGQLDADKVFRNGNTFYNVLEFASTATVDEIVIKTKIPFISGNSMPLVHLKGYAYGESATIEMTVAFYIYNDKFTNMGVVSSCPWKPNVYLSSYTENNTKYVAISFAGSIYYPRFVIDYTDIWSGSSNRDYSSGWTFSNRVSGETTSIIPSTDKVDVSYKAIANNISGNAATATNVAWSGVTSKPSYYDAKAIKGITRSGTTFTYTCMDGTTGTFTQQDNNTTYSVATTSANGLMSSSDKSKVDGMVLATVSEVETYLSI